MLYDCTLMEKKKTTTTTTTNKKLSELKFYTDFSEGWYWFRFNNFRPKIYSFVEKEIKLKVRKCCRKLALNFCTPPPPE